MSENCLQDEDMLERMCKSMNAEERICKLTPYKPAGECPSSSPSASPGSSPTPSVTPILFTPAPSRSPLPVHTVVPKWTIGVIAGLGSGLVAVLALAATLVLCNRRVRCPLALAMGV
jgi:hypothetical protein